MLMLGFMGVMVPLVFVINGLTRRAWGDAFFFADDRVVPKFDWRAPGCAEKPQRRYGLGPRLLVPEPMPPHGAARTHVMIVEGECPLTPTLDCAKIHIE